jgi:hypothetical protein
VGAVLGQEMGTFGTELQGMAAAGCDVRATVAGGAWQMRLLSFPGLRIAGGTDEELRNIIAERVLGLPPELRVDKDIPTGG